MKSGCPTHLTSYLTTLWTFVGEALTFRADVRSGGCSTGFPCLVCGE